MLFHSAADRDESNSSISAQSSAAVSAESASASILTPPPLRSGVMSSLPPLRVSLMPSKLLLLPLSVTAEDARKLGG